MCGRCCIACHVNRDNPLYDDLEDWDKDNHWHFYLPKPEYLAFVERALKTQLLDDVTQQRNRFARQATKAIEGQ